MEDVTGIPGDLIKGKSAYLQGSDEPQMGTLELTGNATDGYVYSGKTYYNTDAKTKRTGTMTVNSILSFSAQAYSGRQVLLKWQNPYAATGKPFSGIHVWYSTGGYPGAGGGTWIYSGYGGNAAPGGWCQAVVTLPNLSTTYYFTACPYATCSAGDMWGAAFNATAATGADLWLTFTVSQSYMIPLGFAKADVFAVGGGASGSNNGNPGGGGGGGGYTATSWNLGVTGGQVLNITVGAGGAPVTSGEHQTGQNKPGGASYVSGLGTVANGGKGTNDARYGSSGGSGGGRSGSCENQAQANGASNGGTSFAYNGDGNGQGTTTRAWGNGTLYSGGGGGGRKYTTEVRGAGGAGGGGAGADDYRSNPIGISGGANTGGGGGGSVAMDPTLLGSSGGTGIILLHLY